MVQTEESSGYTATDGEVRRNHVARLFLYACLLVWNVCCNGKHVVLGHTRLLEKLSFAGSNLGCQM